MGDNRRRKRSEKETKEYREFSFMVGNSALEEETKRGKKIILENAYMRECYTYEFMERIDTIMTSGMIDTNTVLYRSRECVGNALLARTVTETVNEIVTETLCCSSVIYSEALLIMHESIIRKHESHSELSDSCLYTIKIHIHDIKSNIALTYLY